jgi:hypothetical protein
MKTGLAKRLPLLVIGTVMMLTAGTALADTSNKPYIKTFGGDLMTGGWFKNGTNCSSGSGTNYQNPNFSNATITPDARAGGILAYSLSSGTSSGGASSQYGVFSLGEVDGRRAQDGFYSQGSQVGSSVKTLTFANADGTLPFGGKFEGAISQSQCITDYFSKVDIDPSTNNPRNPGVTVFDSTTNWRPIFVNAGVGGTYYSNVPAGGTLDLFAGSGAGDMQLKPGKRIVIYVNGNVYINRNITYDPSATIDNVPKFALIVKGSIYIDNTTTHLDGMYVAEPAGTTSAAVTANDGIIWTCHPNNNNPLDYTYPPTCNTPLVVNGSLIAKKINFLRVNGDINSASSGEDNPSTVSSCTSGSCNVSEVVNYSPAMIIGGSFFNSSNSSSSQGLPIDNIISLPPAF